MLYMWHMEFSETHVNSYTEKHYQSIRLTLLGSPYTLDSY